MLTLADKLNACRISGVPAMIWGDPGIGKSCSVEYLASKLNIPIEVIISSIREPSDFIGLPVINADRTGVDFVPPSWSKTFTDEGILFFDEITTCTPMVQAALLTIILNGRVGEYQLPANVYRCAAGNYTNVAGTHELSSALTNRFVHIYAKADPDVYSSMLVRSFNYELENIVNNKLDSKVYDLNKVYYSSMMAKFIKSNPIMVHKMPEIINDAKDYAYPTPRSLSNVIEILSTLKGNNPELITELIKGCVGEECGFMLNDFFDKQALTNIELTEYLEDPSKLQYQKNADVVSYIISSLLYYMRSHDTRFIEMSYYLINRFYDDGFNYLVLGVMKEVAKYLTEMKVQPNTILDKFGFVKDNVKYLY